MISDADYRAMCNGSNPPRVGEFYPVIVASVEPHTARPVPGAKRAVHLTGGANIARRVWRLA